MLVPLTRLLNDFSHDNLSPSSLAFNRIQPQIWRKVLSSALHPSAPPPTNMEYHAPLEGILTANRQLYLESRVHYWSVVSGLC